MKEQPLIISGLSGSGTRVIVRILKEIDFNFGYDVNISDDDLSFSLLFKLPKHFYRYFNINSSYVNKMMDVHDRLLLNKKIKISDLYYVFKVSLLHIIQFRRYGILWVLRRLKNIIIKRSSPTGLWGWKEPHSVPFLPDIKSYYPSSKFILIVRHGLDMVYSKNDQQFYNYAHYFGLDMKDESKTNRFELWYRFNKYAIEKGTQLFKGNFLIVYYEDIVDMDNDSVKKIFEFIGNTESENAIVNLTNQNSNPGTIDRYKNYDTSWINSEILTKLQEIGYPRMGKT